MLVLVGGIVKQKCQTTLFCLFYSLKYTCQYWYSVDGAISAKTGTPTYYAMSIIPKKKKKKCLGLKALSQAKCFDSLSFSGRQLKHTSPYRQVTHFEGPDLLFAFHFPNLYQAAHVAQRHQGRVVAEHGARHRVFVSCGYQMTRRFLADDPRIHRFVSFDPEHSFLSHCYLFLYI